MLFIIKIAVLALFTISGYLLGLRYGYMEYGVALGTLLGIITSYSDLILRKVDFGTLIGGLLGLSCRSFICGSLYLFP